MNKISYKSALVLFFVVAIALFAALPVAFYIYDPLQIFHKVWGRAPAFHKDMRQQAVGIFHNYDFDSIIIGTSMLENSSSTEAGRKLGGSFVNVSMSSSNHFERSVVLSYLLDKRPLRSVVYSLDYSYLSPVYDHPEYPKSTWAYLYDNNRLNDFKAYYNDKYFLCVLLWSSHPNCIGKAKSLDRPSAWFKNPTHASRFGGLDNWFAAANNGQIKSALRKIVDAAEESQKQSSVNRLDYLERREKVLSYVGEYVVSHAINNPQTNFYYVFPPYSRILFSILHQAEPERALLHEDVVRYIVTETQGMDNVKIIGYEDQEFPDDISNYKDPGHYREEFNDLFFEDMRLGRHVLTHENVDRYLTIAKEKALAFDLVGLGAKIDAYLKSGMEQAQAADSRKRDN